MSLASRSPRREKPPNGDAPSVVPARRCWLLLRFALLQSLAITNPGFPAGHDAGAHLTYVYRMTRASEGPSPCGLGQPRSPPRTTALQLLSSRVLVSRGALAPGVPLSYALKAMPPFCGGPAPLHVSALSTVWASTAAVAAVVYGSHRISSWTSLSAA